MPPRKASSSAAVVAEEADMGDPAAASPPRPLRTRSSSRATARRMDPSSAAAAASPAPPLLTRSTARATARSTAPSSAAATASHPPPLQPRSPARAPARRKPPSSAAAAAATVDDLGIAKAKEDLGADANVEEGRRTMGNKTADLVATDYGDPSTSTEDWLEIGRKFAENFYIRLGTSPSNLHLLYHHECHVSWKIYENSYTMKSHEDIQNVMSIHTIQQSSFCVKNHVVQHNEHSIHVVVGGIHTLDNTASNFIQSFVLCPQRISILNDALVVMLNVPQQLELKVKTASIPAVKTATDVPQQRKLRFKVITNVSRAAEIASQEAARGTEHSEVLVVYNKACLLHVPPGEHDENPDRIVRIMTALERDGVRKRVAFEESNPAERKHVWAVHTGNLLEQVIDNLPLTDKQKEDCPYISNQEGDMYSSAGTKQAVYLAAGAAIKACHSVAVGDFKKSFALIRPPGHHASANFAEGFCYMNNAAIGVKYLQNELKLKKIMVVDIDVHHGNGSQSIFYDDDSVLVFSIHCKKLYPDDNEAKLHTAIGIDKGKGFSVNVPLEPGYGNADILYALDHVLAPLVKAFKPEIIVVSAGFDAAEGDPLGGGCELTPNCYGTIAKKLVQMGDGSLVMCLEGGYGPALGDCVSYCLRASLGDLDAGLSDEEQRSLVPKPDTVKTVRMLKKWLKKQCNLIIST